MPAFLKATHQRWFLRRVNLKKKFFFLKMLTFQMDFLPPIAVKEHKGPMHFQVHHQPQDPKNHTNKRRHGDPSVWNVSAVVLPSLQISSSSLRTFYFICLQWHQLELAAFCPVSITCKFCPYFSTYYLQFQSDCMAVFSIMNFSKLGPELSVLSVLQG